MPVASPGFSGQPLAGESSGMPGLSAACRRDRRSSAPIPGRRQRARAGSSSAQTLACGCQRRSAGAGAWPARTWPSRVAWAGWACFGPSAPSIATARAVTINVRMVSLFRERIPLHETVNIPSLAEFPPPRTQVFTDNSPPVPPAVIGCGRPGEGNASPGDKDVCAGFGHGSPPSQADCQTSRTPMPIR